MITFLIAGHETVCVIVGLYHNGHASLNRLLTLPCTLDIWTSVVYVLLPSEITRCL
jgi:hypothetical protein